jgi:hypothetical protein
MRIMINFVGFIKHNKKKGITIQVWLYTAYYRFCVRFVPMRHLRTSFGLEGLESSEEATEEEYVGARAISNYVNRSANKTPWESKCLIRALTARKLLKSRHIHSTMYLGVGKELDNMVAHAWVRVGKLSVTGGNGEGYAIVAKYML